VLNIGVAGRRGRAGSVSSLGRLVQPRPARCCRSALLTAGWRRR